MLVHQACPELVEPRNAFRLPAVRPAVAEAPVQPPAALAAYACGLEWIGHKGCRCRARREPEAVRPGRIVVVACRAEAMSVAADFAGILVVRVRVRT